MSGGPDDLPAEAYAVALSGLRGIGPARLRRLLERAEPRAAWCAVAREAPRGFDVPRSWADHRRAGIAVHVLGCPSYPASLATYDRAPAVLFSFGSLGALSRPLVALVGTRSATHYGQDVAAELGSALAAAGVGVVSGLALGIDAAAHEGALAGGGAPPVAVVGTGIDVVYPRRNAGLWRRVAAAGCVLSEWPLGTRPDAWRFPLRNRLLAAMAEVVVVVETHSRGGAIHTVDAALAQGVPVMAVPGSVHSPASAGCNSLLVDGAAPVRDVDDILCVLGLQGPARRLEGAGSGALRSGLGAIEDRLLEAIGWEPASTGELLGRTGLELGEVALALDRLAEAGFLRAGKGRWDRIEPSSRRGG